MPKSAKPVEFIQIAVTEGNLYALDKYGRVWAAIVTWGNDGPTPDWYAIDAPDEE